MSAQNKINNNIREAFTIVELLVVIVVIAILAAITIVGYRGVSSNARKSALSSNLEQANKLLNVSKESNSTEVYPSTLSAAGSNLDTSIYTYYPSSDNKDYCLQGTTDGVTKSITGSSQVVQEVACIENGLVGWWKLNGNAKDSSGNNNDGTVYGATPTVGEDNVASHAYSFDGVDDYISVANSDSLLPDSITISGWIYLNSTAHYTLLGKGSGAGSYYIYGPNSSQVDFVLYDSLSNRYDKSASTSIGSWYYIVGTFDGSSGRQKLYVNGVLKSNAVNVMLGGNYSILYIGRLAGGYFTAGFIDDVRIYNRSLSASEIETLYNAGAQ